MKKVVVIVLLACLAVLAFSSCKTAENCPAYASADVNVETVA